MIIQLLSNTPDLVEVYCAQSTDVILLQNGVYSALALQSKFPSIALYALENDWYASGLPQSSEVTLISYAQWVDLCALHQPVITIQ